MIASNASVSSKYKACSSLDNSEKDKACIAKVFHMFKSISLFGLAGLYMVVSGKIVPGPDKNKACLLESFKSVSTQKLNGNG